MNLYKSNKTYKVLKYKNKEEWRKNRKYAIGGSDASSIVNQNPYKTSNKLYREKKGLEEAEDISNKDYVAYGTNAEEYLRKLFELDFANKYEVQYLADCTLESNEYPFMHYSPDGLLIDKETGAKGIFENKTTTIVRSSQREKWNEQVPMNYYVQILYGLLVTGFDFVILKAQLRFESPNGLPCFSTRHYLFRREDCLDDLGYLKQEVIKWWNNYYLANKEPPIKFEI